MAGRGVLSKGGSFSVWKVLLTLLFALTVGANDQKGLLPVSGGYKDDVCGVVVMFARNHQLPSVLRTINQFQRAHGSSKEQPQFLRDWVFYSDEDVSDEFKLLTTNLTLPGTAYYELWAQHDLVYSGWNLPALSQHGRLRDYNWAWSVAPGTEFHSSIDFDVFEAMKSEGMIYGSSTSGLLQAVRPGSANTEDSDAKLPHGVREIRWSVGERPGSGSGLSRSMTVADGQREGTFNSISTTNRTASWMDLVYDVCNSCWDFEMGWLDLFRNIDYSTIARYITTSLSTSFGPRNYQSNPSSCNALIGYSNEPASSAGPRSGVFYLLGNPDDEIGAVHERWMKMASDFDEQRKMPGLRAGFTSSFWRATVYSTKGKRARAWLYREGLSVAKPSGHKYFHKEVFGGEDDDDTSGDDDFDEAGDLFDADNNTLNEDNLPLDEDDKTPFDKDDFPLDGDDKFSPGTHPMVQRFQILYLRFLRFTLRDD